MADDAMDRAVDRREHDRRIRREVGNDGEIFGAADASAPTIAAASSASAPLATAMTTAACKADSVSDDKVDVVAT